MNLRQLEAFRAAMQSGSITGAARILNVSQPSVSRLIGDLERGVGFPLFQRVGRGIVATAEARRLFGAIESMFIGIGRLNELADTIRTTAGGTVSLGVIPAFAQDIMPEAVREIYERRPDVRVMVYMRNTPAIVDAVRIQQFDLGIVGRSPPYEGVDVLFQTSVPYVCLVPRAHRLARGKARLDLAELAGKEPFITFGGAYPDEMLDMDHELSARLRKNSRLFAANMPVAAALARETGALAIVDPFSARLAKRIGGVVSRPIRQSLKYHIAVITRARSALPLIGQEMASVLIKRFRASTG